MKPNLDNCKANFIISNVPTFLKSYNVPGISIALIEDNSILPIINFGVKNSTNKNPIEDDTVYEAASLTKPIIAYTAFLLQEEKLLDLDKPLVEYLDKPFLSNEPLHKLITTRHVLSHTSGLPNGEQEPRIAAFTPGEKFSYSGEGFMYLQNVIEHITQTSIDKYVKEAVFTELSMTNSSLIWEGNYEIKASSPHNSEGMVDGFRKMLKPYSKGSLYTTAKDYGKFIIKLLSEFPKQDSMLQGMFTKQIEINELVSWSLGWGMVTDTDTSYWHWGDNGNFKAFTLFIPTKKEGIVILTNGYNGLDLCKEIIMGLYGEYSAFSKFLEPFYS